jgi:hypothetical protein
MRNTRRQNRGSAASWRQIGAIGLSLIAVMAMVTMPAAAQSTQSQWARTFGDVQGGASFGLVATDEGAVIAGQRWQNDGEESVATLLSLDREGSLMWERTYRNEGGAAQEWVTDVVRTADGFALVGGTDDRGWLLTTDAAGSRTGDALIAAPVGEIGGPREAWGTALQQTPDGGFVVVGGTALAEDGGNTRTLVAALDADLTVEWAIDVGMFDEYGMDVLAVDDGYVVLSRVGGQGVAADTAVRKITPDGGVAWEHRVGSPGEDYLSKIAATPDGGFVAAGQSDTNGDDEDDAWVVKFDAEGQVEWQRTYERIPGNDDTARTVAVTDDGGYLVAGLTRVDRPTSVSFDGWLLKTDADGNAEWDRSFGGPRNEGINDVVELEPGLYALAGYTRSYGTQVQGWVLRVAADADPNDDATAFEPTDIGGGPAGGTATESTAAHTETAEVPETEDGSGASGPGFGVVIAGAAVLVGVATLVLRSRRAERTDAGGERR